MKKRILALHGGRKKGNTTRVLDEIEALFTNHDITLERVVLTTQAFSACKGCMRCITNGTCPLNDDLTRLFARLSKYDGIIFATPVYIGTLSGTMKHVLDRACAFYHRPPLAGIPLLSVATTAASGLPYTFAYLEKAGMEWGLHPAGRIGRTVTTLANPVTDHEIARFISHVFRKKETYAPTLRQLISYQVQRVLAENVLPRDRAFWREAGWDKEVFFYRARIAPWNRLIAHAFHAFFSRVIKPVESEMEAEENEEST